MNNSRREFFKKTTVAAAGTLMIPNFLHAFSSVAGDQSHRRLVVIQLAGGNDGLNTVIPFKNDIYYKVRPTIAIPESDILKLDDEQGFHPIMTGFKELYDNGEIAVLNSVGYPNPNRSHFRSMDIWNTGSASDRYWNSGWLGRYLDDYAVKTKGYKNYHAIEAGNSLSLALKGHTYNGMAFESVDALFRNTQNTTLQKLHNMRHALEHANTEAEYLYKTMGDTFSCAEYLHETTKVFQTNISYPGNKLSRRLKTIADLINSGIDTTVFYAKSGGFDTHANQVGSHKQRLNQVTKSINAFVKDLKQANTWDNTLIMVFSEFGRRVAENGSKGTDHGTAGNLFLIGRNLSQPGIYNAAPDLLNLRRGDLKHEIDFRRVYAEILQKWLNTDSKKILGEEFQKLNIV